MQVVITIEGSQADVFEQESDELVQFLTDGEYTCTDGCGVLTYPESELTGMEGSRTTIKIEPKQITMTRTGTYPSQMRFAEHKREVGLYQTEMGSVAVSTHTSKLTSSIDENGGALAIDYTVEIDAALAGAHQFELSVRPS